MTHSVLPDDPSFSMDAVVTALLRQGIESYVGQTGGGCATIFAGASRFDAEYGGLRYQAIAGPGWFAGPGWTDAQGDTGDFNVGPDDDGETRTTVMPVDTADPVAWATQTIAAQVAAS